MIGRFLQRFRRQPARPPLPRLGPQPPSDPDWAAGDRAQCISAEGGWRCWPTGQAIAGPRRGQILRVRNILLVDGSLWLAFREFAGPGFYSAGYFRKLRPCSAEFAREVREAVPAPPRIPAPVSKPLELVP